MKCFNLKCFNRSYGTTSFITSFIDYLCPKNYLYLEQKKCKSYSRKNCQFVDLPSIWVIPYKCIKPSSTKKIHFLTFFILASLRKKRSWKWCTWDMSVDLWFHKFQISSSTKDLLIGNSLHTTTTRVWSYLL